MPSETGVLTPDALLSELHAAFPDQPVPAESELLNPGSDSEWCRKQMSAFIGRKWTELTAESLDSWSDCLSPRAFAYYLPARLREGLIGVDPREPRSYAERHRIWSTIWDLELKGTDVLVHPNFNDKLRRFHELNRRQSAVVRDFLDFHFDRHPDFSIRFGSANAMERHWGPFGGPRADARRAFYHGVWNWQRPIAADPACESVIQSIEAAFAGTPYPSGEQLTYRASPDEFYIELDLRGQHWRGLHPDFLLLQQSALSFLTPDALRFFLPAFLIADLLDLGPDCVDFPLYGFLAQRNGPHYGHTSERFAPLTLAERWAAIYYLEFVAKRREDVYKKREVEMALENYWLPSVIAQERE